MTKRLAPLFLFLKAQQRGARGRVDDLFGANPPLMDTTIQVRGSVDKEGHVRKPHTRHVKVRAPEVARVDAKGVQPEAAKPAAPKFQPTDEAMATAWSAMSQKERQNALRYNVARMETPGGRLSAEAKRLADGAWSALPEDIRNNRSVRLPVHFKAKQTAEREVAARVPPVPATARARMALKKEVATIVAKTLGNNPSESLKTYIDHTVFERVAA